MVTERGVQDAGAGTGGQVTSKLGPMGDGTVRARVAGARGESKLRGREGPGTELPWRARGHSGQWTWRGCGLRGGRGQRREVCGLNDPQGLAWGAWLVTASL